MPDVVIVGGGIIGCATAYYLAREGASVTILERGEVAGEASGAAAGMLAALSGEAGERGPAFDALCVDSLNDYHKLLPELDKTGVDMHYRKTGVLHMSLDDDQAASLRAQFERVTARGQKATWLDQKALLESEPQVNQRAVAGYVTEDEEYVDPQRATEAMAEAARMLGVKIVTGAAVSRFARRSQRVTSVQSQGANYDCDALLLAAGPWTGDLARRLGSRVPMRPVRGQMLSLQGPPETLRHMVWGDHAYLVPREDGQTYVGATVEEAGFRKHTTLRGLAGLRLGAVGLVPSLKSAGVRRAWAGLRPASLDGLPVMGLLPGWQNVWVSTGHFRNGILMAPASGRLVAGSILAGAPDVTLEPFSPSRFLD